MRKTGFGIIVALAAASVWAGASAEVDRGDDLDQVTLVLDWIPNVNHGGIYLALEHGYFTDRGLAVTVTQPSELGSEALVAAGSGDFGISHQEAVVFARTSRQNLPIVAIAAIVQHNTSGFAAPADRGVTGLGDLAGLRYAGWGAEFEKAMLDALLEPYGSDSSDVEIVQLGVVDLLAAFRRDADFAWIFYGVDGVRAELAGVALDYFELRQVDPRLDYYTPVIIASEATVAERPELARRFLAALSVGYTHAARDPEAAAAALLAYAPEVDAELARAGAAYLAPFLLDDAGTWGTMERGRWVAFDEFLDQAALLETELDIDAAFRVDLLPAR